MDETTTPREGPDDDEVSAGSRDPRSRVGRGLDRGLGAFSAFRDALGETVAEARERGDLTTDRAREVLARAVERARDATADARERFDGPTRAEFEALRRRVEALEHRLEVDPDTSPDPSPGSDADA